MIDMKLEYKKTNKRINQSFFAVRQTVAHLEPNWHFHEEYELIYILKGTGIRIVGDNLANFRPERLVLTGPWLPHIWKNDDSYDKVEDVDVIIIKFTHIINGLDLFSLPEFRNIAEMLGGANRGISFSKRMIQKVADLLISLPSADGAQRIIRLLDILAILSTSRDHSILASPEFALHINHYGDNRLNRLINYISDNFHKPISLDDLATQAAMTKSSLCRFFKSRTNKTIFQFVNEYRIGKALQLMINGKLSISEICFQTGFNSITSFNRVFKQLKNITPSEFKRKYQKLTAEPYQ